METIYFEYTIIISAFLLIFIIVAIQIIITLYIKIYNLEVYNKTLSLINDDIRGYKHDFSNFVQALDGYVKTENIEGIKSMSKSALKECIATNNLENLNPHIINNSAVYSIITNKFYLAQEENIAMNVEVMLDLNELNISNYELCKILGILLDNAIEAASQCKDEKIINVKFIKDTKVNRKLMIIENSYANHNIDINKIFEKGYTTKSAKIKNSHGIGLWNVRRLLKHSENLNLHTEAGKLFIQQLEIYE